MDYLQVNCMAMSELTTDYYTMGLSAKSVVCKYKGACITKQGDLICIWFDDPVDKKGRYLVFDKETALEISRNIMRVFE